MTDARLAPTLFAAFPEVRYVATYLEGRLDKAQRDDLRGASEGESDTYEELLVNPTVLKLVGQRGDIDCGGLDYVLIRYGNFFQLVVAVTGGHVSVALEPTADLDLVGEVLAGIREHGGR